jgi:hypothetical protein
MQISLRLAGHDSRRSSWSSLLLHSGCWPRVLLLATAVTVVALPVLAAGDPFKGITDVIFGNARTWAGALLVVGLLGLGIRFMTGDPESNVQTRNFLWGSIACIAAGLGLGVYDWVASWASVR